MPITGFLKLPDIEGESKAMDHEDKIDVWGVEWGVETNTSTARFARLRARSDMGPLVVHKFYDKSSPLIAEAAQRQRRLDEAILTVSKGSGESRLDYLIITMENVMVSDYRMHQIERDGDAMQIEEIIKLEFQSVEINYAEQNNDGSAGEETSVELSDNSFS